MAISVNSRPEKTLSNGYLSKWNASATPLQYKFSSNLFPTNSVDNLVNTDQFYYDASKKGTFIEAINHGLIKDDWCRVYATTETQEEGVYKVKEVIDANNFVIDLFSNYAGPGDDFQIQKYYKGYKGLVKVFVGSPEYHPYNTDQSKPQREIGIIEVEFDVNNEGVCNVRSFVKPDMSAGFDYNDINSHNAWTAFSIEYAEIHDNLQGDPVFIEDTLENCTPFVGFTNPSFDSGLAGWEQTTNPSSANWGIPGAGEISAISVGQAQTQRLSQNIDLVAGQKYTINLDYDLELATVSDNIAFIFDVDYATGGNLSFKQFFNTQLGAGSFTFDYFPSTDIVKMGVTVISLNSTPNNFTVSLQNFEVTSDVADHCKYSSFSIFGAKQFQDELGGNFGDKIANRLTVGESLTHFDNLTYPFYFNALIPAETFANSEGGDSVYLETYLYDELGNNVGYYKDKVTNQSDGVYTISPIILEECKTWKTGTIQLVSVPGNLLLDGDNGTYENGDPLSWNISELPYDIGTPDQVGSGVFSAEIELEPEIFEYYGDFTYGGPSMVKGVEYKIAQFDTPIQVQIGQTYVIESEVVYRLDGFEPTQRGNANMYLYINGIHLDDQIIKSVKNIAPPSGDTAEYVYATTSTTFTATSSTVNIRMGMTMDVNANLSTGGSWLLNNTTVKGPIEFLTTKKNIESSCGCTYNLHMRWLNDLGGWEQWNFTQYRTENEVVNERLEIKRDITENWDDTFINGDTQYDTIKVESRKEIVVRSGSLRKDQLKAVNQIRRSIKVQALINDKWVTVSLNTGSYLILDENDKTQEITFSIKLPDTLIQEQ